MNRIELSDLPPQVCGRYGEVLGPSMAGSESMRAWGSRYARLVFERCGRNKRAASRFLDISYHTLEAYLGYGYSNATSFALRAVNRCKVDARIFVETSSQGDTTMRLMLLALVFLVPVFHADIAMAQGNAAAGKKLWDSADARCKDCHGVNGEGGFGPDLAGRQLSIDQFKRAVRQPWGVMPAFPETLHSEQELADFFAYLTALPKVAQPGPWQTPLPAGAPKGQELLIATYGCGQCHGALMGGPRANAGAINADFSWFKVMTFAHTTVMPEHRKLLGAAPGRVRMGNFSTTRVPETALAEIFRYLKDDLKFRPALASRLVAGASAQSYNLVVQNNGLVGKGLAAEDITVLLALTPGTKVASTTGAGYQGVRNDPELKSEVAVWQLAKLGAKEVQNYTITVASGGGIARGMVRWTKPMQGTGMADQINVAMPAPTQTN